MRLKQSQTLLLIFLVMVLFSSMFGYVAHEFLNFYLFLGIVILAGIVVGTGYVRFLVEPLEKRTQELELLSRQTLHELNLPVATIQANTQMLLKKEDDEKRIKRLKRIEDASELLMSLYSELDYLIKKQIHKLEPEICDLKELIETKSEAYAELFAHINFVYDLESSSVEIDKIGFYKVLGNLIQNAVKYSKQDSTVTIRLKDFQLSVEDEGEGIEEDFLINVFEHYYQEKDNNAGQGLGLGMVKEYCDANKIKIFIDSKKDIGTCVSLDFNRRKTDDVK